MRENLMEFSKIGGGLATSIWVQNFNTIIAMLIGVATLVYVVIKCVNGCYEWKLNRTRRKKIEENIRKELLKELEKDV